jgi:hypothetical protein
MQAEQVESLRKSQNKLSRSGKLRTGKNIFREYDQILLCCMQVSLLPSRIHVSGLDDIWHMSLSLNTGNVVTFDTTDLSLPTDLVV